MILCPLFKYEKTLRAALFTLLGSRSSIVKQAIALIMTFVGHSGIASELDLSDHVNPFFKDYINFEYVRNYPIFKAQEQFSPHKKTMLVGYTHFLSQEWSVGVTLGFKSFLREALKRELALLSFSNHSHYIIRLHHPTYLLVGTKLSYLAPNSQSNLPLIKEPDFETEIGAGVSIQLTHIFGSYLLNFRIDRWRGTKTNQLHGFEVAIGLSHQLNSFYQ